MQPIQNSGSNGFMDSRVALFRTTGAIHTQTHARKIANRFPPSSRVIRPVNTISAPCASAGRNRIACNESPSAMRLTRVSSATSGAKST